MATESWRDRLREGVVIPAHPLALTTSRTLDERRQRALTRYYLAAGAGGVAVGVHMTQFEIRAAGLYEPVLALAADTVDRPVVMVAGVAGPTPAAVREAETAARLGYHTALVSFTGLREADTDALLAHARAVAEVLPVFGFYLQEAVGGRRLDETFWRRFLEIENVVAIKIAPFDRYATLEVVRAVAAAGRTDDVALYTGNDDHIILDLLTPFPTASGAPIHIVGGLLGHWAYWTERAVAYHAWCRRVVGDGTPIPPDLLRLAAEVTDASAAIFDAAHGFAGVVPGVHEVLRRQGLLAGTWCLDERLDLSPGQRAAIDRVWRQYPHLRDDAFVGAHLDDWLR